LTIVLIAKALFDNVLIKLGKDQKLKQTFSCDIGIKNKEIHTRNKEISA
jgi:hypothetical protein